MIRISFKIWVSRFSILILCTVTTLPNRAGVDGKGCWLSQYFLYIFWRHLCPLLQSKKTKILFSLYKVEIVHKNKAEWAGLEKSRDKYKWMMMKKMFLGSSRHSRERFLHSNPSIIWLKALRGLNLVAQSTTNQRTADKRIAPLNPHK